MVEWLESNRTVDHIVATKYRNDSASSGVSFTRKLCPVRDEDCQSFGALLTCSVRRCSIPSRQFSRVGTRTLRRLSCVNKRQVNPRRSRDEQKWVQAEEKRVVAIEIEKYKVTHNVYGR